MATGYPKHFVINFSYTLYINFVQLVSYSIEVHETEIYQYIYSEKLCFFWNLN